MGATNQSLTIRVSLAAKSILRDLAKKEGKSMQAVLDRAVVRYQREAFLDEANAAFAKLKADPEAWNEELAERELWNRALADGLD